MKIQSVKTADHGLTERVRNACAENKIADSAAGLIAAHVPRTKQIRMMRKKGAEKLVACAQSRDVAEKLKTKKTHETCLLCNPAIAETDVNFLAFLKNLARRRPKLARYVSAIVEELEDEGAAEEMVSVYDRILLAIDAGRCTESEIFSFVNKTPGIRFDRATVGYALKTMLKSSIETVEQGGKPDAARGTRKMLYRRRTEKLTRAYIEARESGYIDQTHSIN